MQYLDKFKSDWFCIVDLDNDYFKELERLAYSFRENTTIEFEDIHTCVDSKNLNDYRLKFINNINQTNECRELIYKSAMKYIHKIVGNELAIQRKVNLSIQMPQDSSSLLPLHSDVWAGNSPYEVVVWIPFMDVQGSQSMYILPKSDSLEIYKNYSESRANNGELYNKIKHKLVWPNVKKGQAIIFSHALIHGNAINEEPKTRLSMNLRFKSLMSPYGDKGLGEYFVPLKMMAATQIGLEVSQFYE